MLSSGFPSVTGYKFDRFRLDTQRRLLLSGSDVRALPEKLFRILLLLLQANGKVVEKEAFFSQVWPEENVTDGNLAQHILLLRKFLGDDGTSHRYIVTIPRVGYQFAQHSLRIVRSDYDILSDSAASLGGMLLDGRFETLNTYCKACHFLEKRTAADLRMALALFEESLELDPNAADGWSGLARAYALLGEYAYVQPSRAFPPARQAVEKALHLNANSETAHALLSEVRMFGDWDFERAQASLDLALGLNPQSLFVRHNLAWFYICSSAPDRAIVEAQRALLLDPASVAFLLILGRALLFQGNYGQAIACFSNVIESDSTDVWARTLRAIGYLFQGAPQTAIDDLHHFPRNGPELPLLARAYVDTGDLVAAAGIAEELHGLAKTQYVSQWDFALVSAALDRRDAALEHLQRALEAREPLMLLLPGLLNLFHPLQKETRLRKLLTALPNYRG